MAGITPAGVFSSPLYCYTQRGSYSCQIPPTTGHSIGFLKIMSLPVESILNRYERKRQKQSRSFVPIPLVIGGDSSDGRRHGDDGEEGSATNQRRSAEETLLPPSLFYSEASSVAISPSSCCTGGNGACSMNRRARCLFLSQRGKRQWRRLSA